MRIAFFTDTYVPNKDGVVTWILSHRKKLEELGHEVYILTPGSKEQKNQNKDKFVYHFTSAQFTRYPDYRLALINVFSPLKYIKEKDIDIIHVHGVATTGLVAIKTAKKYDIPIIATFHTLIPEAVHYISEHKTIKSILNKVAWEYLKWYYNHFEIVLVPSNLTGEILEKHGIKNVVVERPGIDIKRFKIRRDKDKKIDEVMKKYGIPKNKKVVLYLGRISKEKNIDLIIDSVPNITNLNKNVVFVIAGKGPYLDELKNKVKEKSISEKIILFTGYIPDNELKYIYQCADVLIFPSEFDTFGLVVLEAMASGTPTVVKSGSAASEIIKDGYTGYIFKDGIDLSEKVLRAIEDKDKLKENISKEIKKYDINESTKRLLEQYEKLIRIKKEQKGEGWMSKK